MTSVNAGETTPLLVSVDDSAAVVPDKGEFGTGKSGNNLGLLNGVIVPCLLNIVGSVLFLRLSWAVGQGGAAGIAIMFFLGTFQTTLTALSLSALISNGVMKGGGAYYIISRAVGPELGGAIGVCFYFSYSVGCCFYMVSTAESIVQAVFPNSGWSDYSIHLLVGSICLWIGMSIALLGAHCFTKVNVPLFAIQFGSILWGCFSIFFSPDPCLANPGFNNITGHLCGEFWCPNGTDTVFCGAYHGWSAQHFVDNVWFGFSATNCNGEMCSWLVVYALVFTAVTGIFEGANLSGDLRDPNRHIWKGTLVAIYGALLTYLIAIVAFAGGFDRFTLQNNLYVLQALSFGTRWIIIVGIWVACFTSGLGGLMGGSRICQAIARDKIFPGVAWAGRGFGSGDEPRLAILLTGGIAQVALLIGGLDTIAPIITTFFCMSYALVNLSLLLVAVAGTPNFRPRFKYWHWTTALAGFLSNFVVMWVLSWVYALAACGVFAAIVLLLTLSTANKKLDWGDIRMALIYHQVRKFLLRLNPRESHGKLWRPSVLLLVNNMSSPLLQVCNYLKRGGIYVVGDVVLAQHIDDVSRKELQEIELAWLDKVADAKIKAFSQVLVAPSARFGYHNLMTTAGLGAMATNTVVVPLWTRDGRGDTACQSLSEYVHVLRDAALLGRNVVVACGFSGMVDASLAFEPKAASVMELFIMPHEPVSSWGDFSLGPLGSLTLMWGLRTRRFGMRLTRASPSSYATGAELDAERELLVDIVKRRGRFRIGDKGRSIVVVPASSDGSLPSYDDRAYFELCNGLVQRHRAPNASLVFLTMPNLSAEPSVWLEYAEALVQNLGPTLLVHTSSEQEMMTVTI